MYCTNCGKEIDDKAVICVHCGVPTDNYSTLANVKTEQKTNGLAIAGFAVGLASLWFGAFLAIPSVAGLILSIFGMKNKAKYNRCNGLAVAGLVISIVSVVIWVLYWMFFIGGINGAFDTVY